MTSVTSFLFNEEHEMVRKMAYDFTRKEVMPIIKEYDRSHTFPKHLLPKMADLGFLGICLPVRYGGAGMDYIALGIVSEALEYGDSSVRETIAVHLGLHALPIFQWGTEEQKQRWLPDLASGNHIGCFGLTEPGAGSDVAGMASRARRDGDDYLLSGEKMWITLADVADRFLVFAKTDPELGARGISAFVLERGWAGLTTGTIEGKMGVHASNTGWIAMQDVRVPASHRLGEEGEGFKIAMSCLDNARYGVAAGRRGHDPGLPGRVDQVRLRAQDLWQAHRRISTGAADDRPDAAGSGRRRTAGLEGGHAQEHGRAQHPETSVAKWFCTDAARLAADDAVQIHGAYGYSDEYNVERHLRNSKSAVIYEGTSQIHTLMQAAYALGMRQDKPLRCPMPAYDAEAWVAE